MKRYVKLNKESCSKCKSGLCMTSIEDMTVVKGNEVILENINIHIHCGELTALIGTNGAGKSTLLKALIGENTYTGKLEFKEGNEKLYRNPIIGYVPQKLDFDYSSPISVLDIFGATMSKKPVYLKASQEIRKKAYDCLKRVKGEELINKKIGVLSGGEIQRVLLALALLPTPDLLLLDEPVSGIDQNGLKLFYKTVSDLRENNHLSIILVSHDFNLVYKYADKVVFLNNKTIECEGNPKELFNNKKVMNTFGLGLNNILSSNEKGDENNAIF